MTATKTFNSTGSNDNTNYEHNHERNRDQHRDLDLSHVRIVTRIISNDDDVDKDVLFVQAECAVPLRDELLDEFLLTR